MDSHGMATSHPTLAVQAIIEDCSQHIDVPAGRCHYGQNRVDLQLELAIDTSRFECQSPTFAAHTHARTRVRACANVRTHVLLPFALEHATANLVNTEAI